MTHASTHNPMLRRRFTVGAILTAGLSTQLARVLHSEELAVVEVKPLATAYRARKLIGASVANDEKETVGSIDDILIQHPDRVLFAVLSVGGFLGIGDHLVVVPFASLVVDDQHNKVVLPGATKAELKRLPEFHYG